MERNYDESIMASYSHVASTFISGPELFLRQLASSSAIFFGASARAFVGEETSVDIMDYVVEKICKHVNLPSRNTFCGGQRRATEEIEDPRNNEATKDEARYGEGSL